MYLKHSTNYIDSKYIWIHGYNSRFFVAEIPFLAFFFLTQGKEEVWPIGTQPRLIPNCSYICKILNLLVLDIFWKKYHFWLFLVTMVTISKKKKKKKKKKTFLAHVLSWVKAYHYAKFQRNPSTSLARMMVQTYRQTDTQTDTQTSPFIYIYIYIYRRYTHKYLSELTQPAISNHTDYLAY